MCKCFFMTANSLHRIISYTTSSIRKGSLSFEYSRNSVIIAVCASYCGLLEGAVWPSTADFSSVGKVIFKRNDVMGLIRGLNLVHTCYLLLFKF